MPQHKLTTKEFAEEVGCPVTTVHGWVSRGFLVPCGKKGKSHLFDSADVPGMRKFYVENKVATASPSKVVVAALASVSPAPKMESGHRYPIFGASSGKSESLAFGPVKIDTVTDNSLSSAAMVPRIDTEFVLDTMEAVVLANSLKRAEPAWVWGPTGAGKTSGIQQICGMLNWPVYRVNMSGDVTVSDFVGATGLVVDEATGNAVTEFVDGPLIQAMLNGGVLLIDEVSATPASVLMALQSVLERAGSPEALWEAGISHTTFVNTSNGGEVIHAHPRFRVIVSDNTNGQGDMTGAYAGTNVMNAAFRSRFTMWLNKGYPEGPAWSKMVAAKTGASFATATKIVKVAREVNKGSALLGASKVTNQTIISPRDTLAIARLFLVFGDVQIAYKVGLLDGMHASDADRQFVVDLLKNM